jgi:hypothetical protein
MRTGRVTAKWRNVVVFVGAMTGIPTLIEGAGCYSYQNCTDIFVTATTCWSDGGCFSETYLDDTVCTTTYQCLPGGPPAPSRPPLPHDFDRNGVLDSWEDIVATTDPCARNFDTGDRLGTAYGGPNNLPGRTTHPGVDVQANPGDRVASFGDGQVVFSTLTRKGTSSWQSGAGWFTTSCGVAVQVRHRDGSLATYCHLESVQVAEGEYLFAGELLGRVDDNWSGSTTGAHLHITYQLSNGARQEYFWLTDDCPGATQLDPGGC